ncbi:MAG TPA: AAA family ATPase [Candidatus Anaerofilum excrementigallinarum]|nr:AAA family ATPase [Candidatus Anaerofilum excrementigallinarum]
MNIQRAKEEIKHTLQAYLAKDELGRYAIPAIRQRPLLLIGPPGVGKTQIMEQIARECRVGLVSYTITHHTRQSAVGLPMISKEVFDGAEYPVTEYTMSEIIASVHRCIRDTGLREGILFIDEINCVSETLAPTMLQFLQCKTFGNQAVPEGWLIVAAGNPPEYNKSVREFDVVTLDRVRRMDIQPDLAAWKQYARSAGVHGAILAYLELHPEHFYKVTRDVDGMQFVTARGWEDLSALLESYGRLGLEADEELVGQYLQNPDIAADFAAYLSLYYKYGDDYGVEQILAGNPAPAAYARAGQAGFDERLSLVGLLLAGLDGFFAPAMRAEELADACFAVIRQFKADLAADGQPVEMFRAALDARRTQLEEQKRAKLLSRADEVRAVRTDAALNGLLAALQADAPADADEALASLRKAFAPLPADRQQKMDAAAAALAAAFEFLENAFGPGQEMLVFVTELGMGADSAAFLAENPSEKYQEYSRTLLLSGGEARILAEIAADKARS